MDMGFISISLWLSLIKKRINNMFLDKIEGVTDEYDWEDWQYYEEVVTDINELINNTELDEYTVLDEAS